MSAPRPVIGCPPPSRAGSTGQRASFLDECWTYADPERSGQLRVTGVNPGSLTPSPAPPITGPDPADPALTQRPRVNVTSAFQDTCAALAREPRPEEEHGRADAGNADAEREEEARYVYLERLAIAAELGMATEPGSTSELIALRESRRVAAAIPARLNTSRTTSLIDTAIDAFAPFGLRFVSVEPQPPPERDPFAVPGLTRTAPNVHISHNSERPGPPRPCYCCGHARWWSISGREAEGWTCGACHPPHEGHVAVVWWDESKLDT